MKHILLLLLGLFFLSCGMNQHEQAVQTPQNRLHSSNFETKKERVGILQAEIKAFSTFEDAEFNLFNVNGFSNSRTSLPGASSWDYQFVIKVDSADVHKWTEGLLEVTAFEHPWTAEIVKHRPENWQTTSTPQYYERKGTDVKLVVFEEEGVVFKRVLSL